MAETRWPQDVNAEATPQAEAAPAPLGCSSARSVP
jgi:hypothetical protein